MPLLFKDYTDLVLKSYEEKRNANLLSRLLMHPTTANIRQDCLNVYLDRMNKGQRVEENILTAFFGVPASGKNFGHVIARYSPDKFRPFQKLIKREVKNPSLATVELLAWLIDFNPRPLAYAQSILGITTNIDNLEDTLPYDHRVQTELNLDETDFTEKHPDEPNNDIVNLKPHQEVNTSVKAGEYAAVAATDKIVQRRKLNMVFTVCLVIATLLGGTYMSKEYFRKNTAGCMYWAEDHYESVPCNEKLPGRLLIAFDEEKVNFFKKIKRLDTITEWSIGKIYYLKTNKVLEYFTAGGKHPIYLDRSLKILSEYMFDTYLRKQISGTDSLALLNKKPL